MKRGKSKTSSEEVAIKICSRKGLDKEDEQAIREEVSILQSISHPNVTKILNYFEVRGGV